MILLRIVEMSRLIIKLNYYYEKTNMFLEWKQTWAGSLISCNDTESLLYIIIGRGNASKRSVQNVPPPPPKKKKSGSLPHLEPIWTLSGPLLDPLLDPLFYSENVILSVYVGHWLVLLHSVPLPFFIRVNFVPTRSNKISSRFQELHENKHLTTGPKGNSEFCFPETLNIEVEEVEVAPLPNVLIWKYTLYL